MRSFIDKGYGWPLFVVVLLVSSVAMMGIVVMAARSDGGAQVIDDYYEQAVRWDSLAEARQAATRLGWSAILALSSDPDGIHGVITLSDSTGIRLDNQNVSIRLRRPQLAGVVAQVEAVPSGEGGQYVFSADVTGTGLWDVEALFSSDEQVVQFDWRRELR